MHPKALLWNVCFPYPVVSEGIFTGINKIWQPISLAYACSILKDSGFEALLIDANAERFEGEWRRSIGFDVVFISSSAYDRWECPHLDIRPVIDTVKGIKRVNSGVLVVLVGAHATERPREMLELTGADCAIIGEPENAILGFCKSFDDWRSAGSIAYIEDGKLFKTGAIEPVDLEMLPIPDFSMLPMDRYNFDMLGGNFAVVETSRGCPFNCFYCLKSMFGGYRSKSLEKVKKEITQLVSQYGVKNINFLDLEFTIDRKLVEGICNWMIEEELGIRWCAQTRLDSVDLVLLKKMKEAGCTMLMFGVESAEDRVLEGIGKNITVEKIRSGIVATREAGIESTCFFMVGFPGESPEDREKTVEFALELDPDYASFFVCRPYPGTRLFEVAKDDVDGLFPTGIGGEKELTELKDFCDGAFNRFYMRPRIILRRLRKGGVGLLIKQSRLFLHKRGIIKGD